MAHFLFNLKKFNFFYNFTNKILNFNCLYSEKEVYRGKVK